MILLKAAILFVLANPAEFYPLTENKPCGECIRYIIDKVPEYPKQQIDIQQNSNYPCGKANPRGLPDMKNNNVTETKNTKIVNGQDAQKNEFPWQVGLAFAYGGDIDCGGSIISSKEILTAAHCVQDRRYKFPDQVFPIKKCIYAVVGEHDKSKKENEQWNRICDVKVHRDYKGKTWELILGNLGSNIRTERLHSENDFAVLTLCTELQFSARVAPVCFPKETQGTYNEYVNKAVIASGWGKKGYLSPLATTILQKVELKTLSNTDCFDPTKYKWPSSDNDQSKICAYGTRFFGFNGKDTCHGDSGGPLVISDKDRVGDKFYTLIGVTSYGYECAQSGYPGVYGRVTYAMTWINQANPDGTPGIQGTIGKIREESSGGNSGGSSGGCVGWFCCSRRDILMRKNTNNSRLRSLKNTGGTIYYHFEKDKKLSRKKAQETCKSKYGGQLTSINTKDEYDWIKKQVIDLKMIGQIAIGGQWKDKSSTKFEWTDKSEMDMSVLNANWFRTRNYQFPSYKNKKRINLELWYSRRALGFANALDHKAPTMYICKVAPSCSA